MRVKAKINIGRQDFAGGMLEGEVKSVPEADGRRMIRRGWAVEVPAEEDESQNEPDGNKTKGKK